MDDTQDDGLLLAEPAGGGSDAAYLGELRRAWVNEKAAPELLKCVPNRSKLSPRRACPRLTCPTCVCRYKREVVERLMRLVQLQVRLRPRLWWRVRSRGRGFGSERLPPTCAGGRAGGQDEGHARHNDGQPVPVRRRGALMQLTGPRPC